MKLVIPEGVGTGLFKATCLDSDEKFSCPENYRNTCMIRRNEKPRKIAWSVQLLPK
jgi:hypothetical protein